MNDALNKLIKEAKRDKGGPYEGRPGRSTLGSYACGICSHDSDELAAARRNFFLDQNMYKRAKN